MSGRALAVVVASAAAAGCGAPEGDGPAVDSTLVEALAELHLVDARAALDTTDAGPALAESLRARALAAHGLDSVRLAARLDGLADDPALARATYDALDTRLALERQGITAGQEAPAPPYPSP